MGRVIQLELNSRFRPTPFLFQLVSSSHPAISLRHLQVFLASIALSVNAPPPLLRLPISPLPRASPTTNRPLCQARIVDPTAVALQSPTIPTTNRSPVQVQSVEPLPTVLRSVSGIRRLEASCVVSDFVQFVDVLRSCALMEKTTLGGVRRS